MKLDPFYPVVPDSGWVAKLLPGGTKLVQLRIKDQPDAEVRRQVREAKAACAAHDAQLIVNDYWQVAIDEGCDYVHLGQEDLVDADVKALRRAGIRIGVSTHDHAELEKGLAVTAGAWNQRAPRGDSMLGFFGGEAAILVAADREVCSRNSHGAPSSKSFPCRSSAS